MAKNRKLGRTSDIRKSMLRSLATEVIMYGKLETTETRAKEVRSVVEELITLGKRGDLHARRQAAAVLHNVVDAETGKTAVQKLFDDVAPKYKDVKGDTFDWLYVDFQTLSLYASECGFKAELIKEGKHYDYLVKLSIA